MVLTLIFPGGGRGPYYHPLSEIHDFSGTEPPLDCWKKTRALYLSWFNRGGTTKFENTFFQIAELRFLTKQAGTKLGQAQLILELRFNLIKICSITDY